MSVVAVSNDNRRRFLRYRPDPRDAALVMYTYHLTGVGVPFRPDIVALIIEQSSMGGAQLVLPRIEACQEGDRIGVQLGRLHPLPAEVVWRREVEEDLIRIGFRFLR